MDSETIVAVTSMAETITSIGILLLWIWAERRDNRDLFHIIQALSSLRLRQIERDTDDKVRIDKPRPGKDINQ